MYVLKGKKYLLFLIPLCIVAFGIFVYPTLYKYDKLDQKYPVMINRITGETKVLTGNGWSAAGDYNRAAEKMKEYKDQIMDEISLQRENIKNETINELRNEINGLVSEELAGIDLSQVITQNEESYDKYDAYREAIGIPTIGDTVEEEYTGEYFSQGDSTDKVKEIMGTPDRITGSDLFQIWTYGNSSVSFKEGLVSGFNNTDNNLHVE